MSQKRLTCTKCGAEFELVPNKPGFATVCPQCSDPGKEQREREVAMEKQMHKSLMKSVKTNAEHSKKERKEKIMLERIGYELVPGKKIIIEKFRE